MADMTGTRATRSRLSEIHPSATTLVPTETPAREPDGAAGDEEHVAACGRPGFQAGTWVAQHPVSWRHNTAGGAPGPPAPT
jgi:hypothetical protein